GGDPLQRLQLLARAVEARGGGEFGELPVGAVEVVLGGGAVVGHPRRAGGELAHRAQVAATAGHERAARQREGQAQTPASVHGLLLVQVPRWARFRRSHLGYNERGHRSWPPACRWFALKTAFMHKAHRMPLPNCFYGCRAPLSIFATSGLIRGLSNGSSCILDRSKPTIV